MTESPASFDAMATVDLVARARGGDETAWEILMRRYRGPLQRFARSRLARQPHRLADTDDVVQDVTINVFRRLHRIELRFPGALLAYLRRSVSNRVADEHRRAVRQGPDGDARRQPAGRSPVAARRDHRPRQGARLPDGAPGALPRRPPGHRDAPRARRGLRRHRRPARQADAERRPGRRGARDVQARQADGALPPRRDDRRPRPSGRQACGGGGIAVSAACFICRAVMSLTCVAIAQTWPNGSSTWP